MKKPTNKLSLNRETIRPLQADQLGQINGGSLSGSGTSVISVSSGTSVISISSGTSVISRNPSGGSRAPSGG